MRNARPGVPGLGCDALASTAGPVDQMQLREKGDRRAKATTHGRYLPRRCSLSAPASSS